MDRAEFISKSLIFTLAMRFLSQGIGQKKSGPIHVHQEIKSANDLNILLRSLVQVDEPSADEIELGSPETKIKKIGICWPPHLDTLKKAKAMGINVVVAHEPLFYFTVDPNTNEPYYWGAGQIAIDEDQNITVRKKKWIEDNEMVIIRCHDVIDKLSEKGIPFALGEALRFSKEDIIKSEVYYDVYKFDPKPAIVAKRHFAEKLRPWGLPGIAFYGEENRMVSNLGVGTG